MTKLEAFFFLPVFSLPATVLHKQLNSSNPLASCLPAVRSNINEPLLLEMRVTEKPIHLRGILHATGKVCVCLCVCAQDTVSGCCLPDLRLFALLTCTDFQSRVLICSVNISSLQEPPAPPITSDPSSWLQQLFECTGGTVPVLTKQVCLDESVQLRVLCI